MTRFPAKVCVSATILLLSLACSRSASYYIGRGKQLRTEGKVDDAALNFQKAIQKDTQNGEAYRELGATYLQQKKGREAYLAYYRAVELLPDNDEVKVQLADLSLAGYLSDPSRPRHFYERIVDLSQQLLLRNPNSFDGHRLNGSLAILDRKPEQALGHLRKANEIKPNDPRVIQALTQILFELHQPDEAEQIALRLIEQRKDFGPIYDTLYSYYESALKATEARSLIEKKVANNPKNALFRLQLAAHYARIKSRQAMTATLQQLLDVPQDFPDARLQVGDFYLALGDPEQARRYYEEGAKSSPAGKTEYKKRLVMLLVAQRRGGEGLPLLDEILKAKPDDAGARAARASLLLEKPGLADRERAAQEFQDLVAKSPQDGTLRYELGKALNATGKPDPARKQLVESIRLSPGAIPPRFALAELALVRRDYAEAIADADGILKLRKQDRRARLIRAIGLTGTGEVEEAGRTLKQLLKEEPGLAAAELQLGHVYLAQGKFSEAEAVFRKYSTSGKSNFRAAEGLAQVYMRQKQPLKSVAIWQQEVDRAPEPSSRLALAATAIAAGQHKTAIEQYQALIAQDPKSGGLRQLVAFAYEQSGDYPAAIASLQKAIELDPNDTRNYMALGQILENSGKTQEAAPLYRRVLQLQPDNAPALNNLAFALSETGGNLDEALQLALRAQKLMPGQANAADTLGWIYVKQNKVDSAVPIFKTLVRKNPEKATYRYHLGAALLLKGEKATAGTELQAALRSYSGKPEESKIREMLKQAEASK